MRSSIRVHLHVLSSGTHFAAIDNGEEVRPTVNFSESLRHRDTIRRANCSAVHLVGDIRSREIGCELLSLRSLSFN